LLRKFIFGYDRPDFHFRIIGPSQHLDDPTFSQAALGGIGKNFRYDHFTVTRIAAMLGGNDDFVHQALFIGNDRCPVPDYIEAADYSGPGAADDPHDTPFALPPLGGSGYCHLHLVTMHRFTQVPCRNENIASPVIGRDETVPITVTGQRTGNRPTSRGNSVMVPREPDDRPLPHHCVQQILETVAVTPVYFGT